MKTIVITEAGRPEVMQLQERPRPEPAKDEVLIKVKAAGVNHADLLQRQGKYGEPGKLIITPGMEVAGIVAKCGGHVQRWKEGDRVCALMREGGYAEYAVVDARHCLPVPAGFTFEQAASLPETVLTVWYNVFQLARLKEAENFLVHGGSSGIGITAIQLANAFGAQVFATAGTAEKCHYCEELGARKCVNYKEEDFVEALKDEGIDVVLDMVGGEYTERNMRLMNDDGRLVFIASLGGSKSSFNVLELMKKRITITGSMLSPRDKAFKAKLIADAEKYVWPLFDEAKFKTVIHKVFPLEEAPAAHRLMQTSQHIGKIILKVE